MTKKEIIIECPITGICKIDVDELIRQWKLKRNFDKFYISQWINYDSNIKQFTLCKQNLKSGNFSKTSLKVTIDEVTANTIIKKLNFKNLQSFMRSGSTWKLEPTEFRIMNSIINESKFKN